MEERKIDIAGQTVAIWCDDPAAREQIDRALAPLRVRLAAARVVADIRAAEPACVVFYLPPLHDPAFVAAWTHARQQRRVPAIRIMAQSERVRMSFGDFLTRLPWILFDDHQLLPFDEEELMLRVRRRIEILMEKQRRSEPRSPSE